MKTELQNEHLAIYVPHGLKFQYKEIWNTTSDLKIQELLTLSTREKSGYQCVNADSIRSFNTSEIKPLLLPLGDLTLTNQATGNPYFIDVLQVVCPLPFQGRNNKFWKCMITGTANKIKSTGFLEIDNKFNDYSFSIDLENGDLLIYHGDDLSVPDGLFNYFNELAKYHFDFQSLIVHGLALNKNDYVKS